PRASLAARAARSQAYCGLWPAAPARFAASLAGAAGSESVPKVRKSTAETAVAHEQRRDKPEVPRLRQPWHTNNAAKNQRCHGCLSRACPCWNRLLASDGPAPAAGIPRTSTHQGRPPRPGAPSWKLPAIPVVAPPSLWRARPPTPPLRWSGRRVRRNLRTTGIARLLTWRWPVFPRMSTTRLPRAAATTKWSPPRSPTHTPVEPRLACPGLAATRTEKSLPQPRADVSPGTGGTPASGRCPANGTGPCPRSPRHRRPDGPSRGG